MKLIPLFVLLFTFGINSYSQNFKLKIIGSSSEENKVIDSLKYNPVHLNAKNIIDEINSLSNRLSKMGHIENQVLENNRKNDSSFIAKFSLGEKIKFIHIYIGKKILPPTHPHPSSLQRRGRKKGEGAETENDNNVIKNMIVFDKNKDTLALAYTEIESFLNTTLQKLEQNGFAFAKLKLTNITRKKKSLYAELEFESGQQRQLNSIVVKFEESNKKNSFPEGHLKQINRKYKNNTFNQEIIRKIQDDFEKFGFVRQIKNPEILFTKDTTKVYVYLEKRNSNSFDGFIGFANNESDKLTFNGYLDLSLENTIKAGEQFSLYWKSDGNNQKTFKASFD